MENNSMKDIPELYKLKKECCGCSACCAICPVTAIRMVEDEEGFEYPKINETKCIRCYRCVNVCPIKIYRGVDYEDIMTEKGMEDNNFMMIKTENKDNQDLNDSFNLTTIIDFFIEFLRSGTEDTIKSIEIEDLNDFKNLAVDISKFIDVFNKFQKVLSIPDKLFFIKLKKYCEGLTVIPEYKREQYVKRAGKESLNKDSVFIFQIINSVEELEKLDIFVKLFKARIYDSITENTYRRMMIQVNRTMYSDILFLRDNISEASTKIDSVEKENLLAMGWLRLKGFAATIFGEEGNDKGTDLYFYTDLAKEFCRIVFCD